MRSPLRRAAQSAAEFFTPPRPVPALPGARVFAALAVQVLDGTVRAMDGTPLGPLAGCQAQVVDASGHAIHGVITANPLPSRRRGTIVTEYRGTALVAFRDGKVHQRRVYGRQFLTAQNEAVVLNTMAGR